MQPALGTAALVLIPNSPVSLERVLSLYGLEIPVSLHFLCKLNGEQCGARLISVLNLFRPQYGIVLDAGSSHTNLYIYKWPAEKENDTGVVQQLEECQVKGKTGTRGWGERAREPTEEHGGSVVGILLSL